MSRTSYLCTYRINVDVSLYVSDAYVESNCARSKVIAKCHIGMYCMALNFQGALRIFTDF